MAYENPIEAFLKLNFLMCHPVPRRVLGHDDTMVSFAEKLGIARKTLIDQRDNRRLTSYVQTQLAKKLDFRLDWPEWLTGTQEEFCNRYLREHSGAVEPADPTPRRRYDPSVRLMVQQMVRDSPALDDDRSNLASLSLFLQQAGPGESIPVSVELVCQPEPVGGFEIAVYRGRLEIAPGTAAIEQRPPPLASDTPQPLCRPDRTLTLQRANASSKDGRIAWTVSSDKGPIGVLRLDDDVHLCRIAEPVDGDIIAVMFHAYVKDLDLIDPDPDEDEKDGESLYSFLRPNEKPLSPTKRQLIKRAILKEELGPAPKGWHTIAEDRRRLVRDGR
jgi:hypothetical protein